MGTRKGKVYILDFNGNTNQTFSNHDSAISELSIDERGEFIASCSLSGTYTFPEHTTTHTLVDALFGHEPTTQARLLFMLCLALRLIPLVMVSRDPFSQWLWSLITIVVTLANLLVEVVLKS